VIRNIITLGEGSDHPNHANVQRQFVMLNPNNLPCNNNCDIDNIGTYRKVRN